MVVRTPRRILVVQRGWPQQENPDLPLLPADAPAVLAGRVATAAARLPADAARLPADAAAHAAVPADLAARVREAATSLVLALPEDAVLQEVCDHAVRAAGAGGAELRLVAADAGTSTLVYALLTPIAVAAGGRAS